jgi:hypothetical protein
MKTDIDKLLLLAKTMNELVKIGESVMKDGKIDLMDIPELPALAEKIGDIITLAKASKELVEEGKDIDALEAVEIVRELLK